MVGPGSGLKAYGVQPGTRKSLKATLTRGSAVSVVEHNVHLCKMQIHTYNSTVGNTVMKWMFYPASWHWLAKQRTKSVPWRALRQIDLDRPLIDSGLSVRESLVRMVAMSLHIWRIVRVPSSGFYQPASFLVRSESRPPDIAVGGRSQKRHLETVGLSKSSEELQQQPA